MLNIIFNFIKLISKFLCDPWGNSKIKIFYYQNVLVCTFWTVLKKRGPEHLIILKLFDATGHSRLRKGVRCFILMGISQRKYLILEVSAGTLWLIHIHIHIPIKTYPGNHEYSVQGSLAWVERRFTCDTVITSWRWPLGFT